MTPQEFKAWFDGFTEAFGNKLPTKVQWARIRERVGEIDGKQITQRIFADRWLPYYSGYWPSALRQSTISCTNTLSGYGTATYTAPQAQTLPTFNSASAMYAVGQADAARLEA